ncbi:hypothetical protein OIU74_004592, partial [Salix koriyanagi]
MDYFGSWVHSLFSVAFVLWLHCLVRIGVEKMKKKLLQLPCGKKLKSVTGIFFFFLLKIS